jgi:lysophospholipase L1-like esterase
MTLLVVGDSFTYGEELDDRSQAWPYMLNYQQGIYNKAQPGYSNDAIVNSTVAILEQHPTVEHVIVAWTTPHRIEVNGKHLTPTSHLRYGSICDHVFLDWDESWAISRFFTQAAVLNGYLKSKQVNYLFVKTFDVPDCRTGNWLDGQMVEWMGDCPKGPGGHPLELGHQRIAERINEHIRHLGWLS